MQSKSSCSSSLDLRMVVDNQSAQSNEQNKVLAPSEKQKARDELRHIEKNAFSMPLALAPALTVYPKPAEASDAFAMPPQFSPPLAPVMPTITYRVGHQTSWSAVRVGHGYSKRKNAFAKNFQPTPPPPPPGPPPSTNGNHPGPEQLGILTVPQHLRGLRKYISVRSLI